MYVQRIHSVLKQFVVYSKYNMVSAFKNDITIQAFQTSWYRIVLFKSNLKLHPVGR